MSSLKITGAWTKAGIASCVRVQGNTKHDDFLLDCGVLDSETLSSKFILITHGHMDHVGASISHARAKALSGAASTYYVPPDICDSLNEAKVAFEKMDGSEIPMNIKAVSPGDSFLMGSNLKVKVFSTNHRVPSQGYAVYSIKKGELLPEFRSTPKEELGALRRSGVHILSDDSETLELVYTGDTTFEGLLDPDNAFIFDAPIFITELTYLDGDQAKAGKYGHIHIQDVVDHQHLFAREDQSLVFVHLSQKYSFSRALKLLREQIPSRLHSKVKVSLHSFGASEPLTRIDDSRWAHRENHQAGWGWATRNTVNFNYNSVNGSNANNSHTSGGRVSSSFSVQSTDQSRRYNNARPFSAGRTGGRGAGRGGIPAGGFLKSPPGLINSSNSKEKDSGGAQHNKRQK